MEYHILNFRPFNEGCCKEEILSASEDLAKKMLNSAPIALKQAKYAINHGGSEDLQTGLVIESKAYESHDSNKRPT
jgi:enoyl-CoA hydratase/carnithine racemase